jgi:5-methylcytosine-specific restriction protein A
MTCAKLRNPTTRATDEWIGASPDAKVPPRVVLRVCDRYGWICHWSGRKITASDKADCDHLIAISAGGENRESNLRPILRDKHKEKTAQDMKVKRKITKVRMRHNGLAKGARNWPSAPKAVPEDKIDRVRKSHENHLAAMRAKAFGTENQ